MGDNYILVDVLLSADSCHGLITGGGYNDTCGKPAVAVIRDPEELAARDNYLEMDR